MRKELEDKGQGTRDEALSSMVPHDRRLTSESLAKTNKVYEEL